MYFVGSVRNPGHVFSTFLVGEYVSEENGHFVVANVIKVIENPNPNPGPSGAMQIGLMFLHDEFFTSETPVKIQKDVLLLSKILDPDKDSKMIRHLDNHYAKVRATKSGLVLSAPTPTPNFSMVRE